MTCSLRRREHLPGRDEKLLERHAAVAQAIVVAAPDDIKDISPLPSFAAARRGSERGGDQAICLAGGTGLCPPRFVEFVPSLPVSGTHKIDRSSLSAEAARIVRAAAAAHERLPRSHYLGLRRPRARFAPLRSAHGVSPRYGGVHASGLTHNALVALGPRCYLGDFGAGEAGSTRRGRLVPPRSRAHEPARYHLLHAQSAPAVRIGTAGGRVGRQERRGIEQWPHHPRGSRLKLAMAAGRPSIVLAWRFLFSSTGSTRRIRGFVGRSAEAR